MDNFSQYIFGIVVCFYYLCIVFEEHLNRAIRSHEKHASYV